MQDLEKEIRSDNPEKYLDANSCAISLITSGSFISIYLEGFYTKVFGGAFIAAGLGTLWLGGYSPIKMCKGLLENVGKLACLPYDYIKREIMK
ncbi:MAG: hypothetical protein Q8N63_03495 [Nanoarchaeota archaeon]|nr:hypothetical protein [Nanoarchaeota archaeon]